MKKLKVKQKSILEINMNYLIIIVIEAECEAYSGA